MKLAWLLLALGVAAEAAGTETKIRLPSSRTDLQTGQKLFTNQCALCHGPRGEGGKGPPLARARLPRASTDAALLKILEDGIRGTEMPGAGAMSDREIRQTAAFVRSLGKVTAAAVPGDAARGAELYRGKGNCSICHAIRGEGGVAGPDLSTIGESRSTAYLRESIVNPDAAVPDGYLRVTAVPKSGARVEGVRVDEDSFSIQVRDAAGRTYSFWKKDLAQLDKLAGKSSMPSFQGVFHEAELTDLVAYLASLKETN